MVLTFTYTELEKADCSDRLEENIDITGTKGRLHVNRHELVVHDAFGKLSCHQPFNALSIDAAIKCFTDTMEYGVVSKEHPLHPRQALADLALIEKILSHLDAHKHKPQLERAEMPLCCSNDVTKIALQN